MEAFSNSEGETRENFKTQRDQLRDAFFLATLWQHLGPKILARAQDNIEQARHLNGRRAGWTYCYENAYPSEPEDLLERGASTARALHLDAREVEIPQEVTVENYWHDLRDASLHGDGAILEKPGIPAQPKLYLPDQRHYVAGRWNIPFPLESLAVFRNWRQVMEENYSSGYDYEAGIVFHNPNLLWFHIARSDGFFATDAERLDACLSDTYYREHTRRIPLEPTQHFSAGSNPGEELQSAVEE